VRIGMLLVGVLALYAALGSVPLGSLLPGTERLGLDPTATLRHHPMLDMTEGAYFSTPLFLLLLAALVLSMLCATIARMRSDRASLAGLVAHAGIALLAVGAALSGATRMEADILLTPGTPTSTLHVRGTAELSLRHADVAVERTMLRLPRYSDANVPWSATELPEQQKLGTVRTAGYAVAARLEPAFLPDPAGIDVWSIRLGGESMHLAPGERRDVIVGGTPVAIRHAHDLGALEEGQTESGALLVSLHGRSALVRTPVGTERRITDIEDGGRLELGSDVALEFTVLRRGVRPTWRPERLSPEEMRPELDEYRARSVLGVRTESGDMAWLPYAQFGDLWTALDDGTHASYGPARMEIPDCVLTLESFDVDVRAMTPRSVTATVRVIRGSEVTLESIGLNTPLRLRTTPVGLLDWLVPQRWTLSIAGWDREGWQESKAARFVVLRASRERGTMFVVVGALLLVAAAPLAAMHRLRRRTT
jgi:hypothetical protein